MWILSNVALCYDGTSATEASLHEGMDVHVDPDGGRIREVRPHDPTLKPGEAHRSIDASGYTVVPGLVDCHGHVTVLGLTPSEMELMLGGGAMTYVEKHF